MIVQPGCAFRRVPALQPAWPRGLGRARTGGSPGELLEGEGGGERRRSRMTGEDKSNNASEVPSTALPRACGLHGSHHMDDPKPPQRHYPPTRHCTPRVTKNRASLPLPGVGSPVELVPLCRRLWLLRCRSWTFPSLLHYHRRLNSCLVPRTWLEDRPGLLGNQPTSRYQDPRLQL